jgi:16S rRNA (guanine527-N7)-methyltransferase
MEKISQETQELIQVTLTDQQAAQLSRYHKELDRWNERYSLTAIRDPDKVRVKHFLDSFSCALVMEARPGLRIIDVGTGAGFPGIPLKILFPESMITLVDSVRKKVEFCQHIIDELALEGIQVIRDRAERLGQDPAFREAFDWAVARAVAQLPELAEYLLPLVRRGGSMLAMKGETGPAEAQRSAETFEVLGGELDRMVHLTLPGVREDRYLVVVKKTAPTPKKFPRRVGVPGKSPLLQD